MVKGSNKGNWLSQVHLREGGVDLRSGSAAAQAIVGETLKFFAPPKAICRVSSCLPGCFDKAKCQGRTQKSSDAKCFTDKVFISSFEGKTCMMVS